jgi:hypothetical protein
MSALAGVVLEHSRCHRVRPWRLTTNRRWLAPPIAESQTTSSRLDDQPRRATLTARGTTTGGTASHAQLIAVVRIFTRPQAVEDSEPVPADSACLAIRSSRMRAVRGINPWTSGFLLLVALLLGFLGVLQLTRALPKEAVVARGSVFGSNHRLGSRYSGESWEVYIDVSGHGSQIAYSHGLYDAVQRTDPLAHRSVTVHMRGALVTRVDLDGHPYQTAAVSSTEAWIEAVVLLAFCALTLFGLARMARRAGRSSGVGAA